MGLSWEVDRALLKLFQSKRAFGNVPRVARQSASNPGLVDWNPFGIRRELREATELMAWAGHLQGNPYLE